MTGAIVNLLDGWTLLAILAGCSLVYVGHLLSTNRAYDRGWHQGRRALIRETRRRVAHSPEAPGSIFSPSNVVVFPGPGADPPRPSRPLFDQEAEA